MQNPLGRAWQETVRSYRLTWGTAARFLLGSAAAIGLIYQVLGESAAMTEAWVILLTLLAVAGACFLPAFLWNLWLAPYKILHDRFDTVADARSAPQVESDEQGPHTALRRKHHDAQRDMRDLHNCLAHGHRGVSRGMRRHLRRDCEHYVPTLQHKYAAWLPPEEAGANVVVWIGRIIAVLNVHDYEAADTIIKSAVAKGSFDD